MRETRGRDLLVIAGGIGLAPLRPVIFHVLRHRGDYGRLIVLYGARSPKDLLFRKQLAAWNYVPDTQVLTTVDYGGLSWRGYVGVVTTLFRYTRIRPDRTTAMICGPEVMMRFVVQELKSREFPARRCIFRRTKHEVRHRTLRTLSDRSAVRVQGRPRVPI